jgi:hypothetical protein
VKWSDYGNDGDLIYRGDGFCVHVIKFNGNWWAYGDKGIQANRYAPDYATAKRDAERWILEREGRLPAPATDGGWIACSERMPEVGVEVEMICRGAILPEIFDRLRLATTGPAIYWRPRPVDPHADAACLFSDRYRPTVEQARAAARHVAGCVECQAKLEEKGGA